jgi:hypothetical protein
MALYDSADLLTRFRDYADRPDDDQDLTDAKAYRYLTDAQVQVVSELAAIFPRMLMGDPVLLTTTDNGATYTLGDDTEGDPIIPYGHAEVYASISGLELYGATYAGFDGDVVFEGGTIRIPAGQTRTFDSGPYIRYVALPLAISATDEPTLVPKQLRNLILFRALVLWANTGGHRDPRPYEEMYQQAWMAALKLQTTQYRQQASIAMPAYWRTWVANGGPALIGVV